MATPLVIANTFTNGVASVAADVNTNFTDIKNYINASVIATDVFPAMPSVPAGVDPTVNDHVARKKYVDDRAGNVTNTVTTALQTYASTAYVTIGGVQTVTNPSKKVNTIVWASGWVKRVGFDTEVDVKVGISYDGGTVYTESQQFINLANVNDQLPFSLHCAIIDTLPSAGIKLRLQAKSSSAASSTEVHEARMTWQVTKAVAL